MMHIDFPRSIKEVLNVHGVWYSANTLPTMVRGQAFLIIN